MVVDGGFGIGFGIGVWWWVFERFAWGIGDVGGGETGCSLSSCGIMLSRYGPRSRYVDRDLGYGLRLSLHWTVKWWGFMFDQSLRWEAVGIAQQANSFGAVSSRIALCTVWVTAFNSLQRHNK